MTTLKTVGSQSRFRLLDPPPRDPDEMTSIKHLTITGSAHYLTQHLGNPGTTLVSAELYIVQATGSPKRGRRRPDLLIAFDVDTAAYYRSNGYVISEQGKPPDFVLEVASESTAETDLGAKRDDYQRFGIPEYWRFDETGEYYGERLVGERLVDGEYRPIPIERLSEDILQGHSDILDLNVRWHDGQLEWFDPATGRHIVTLDDERQARIEAEAQVRERDARIGELEEEIRRLRSNRPQ